MMFRESFGWLIAGTIDKLVMNAEPIYDENMLIVDYRPAGCCNLCCGPCSALLWLRENAPGLLDRWVALTGNGSDWFATGTIDWTDIDAQWAVGPSICVCQGLGVDEALRRLEEEEEGDREHLACRAFQHGQP
jgi:hypothetical protein